MTHQKVFVLRYDHKYGEDLGVYASQEKAYEVVREIILSWIGDLESKDEGTASRVRAAIVKGDIDLAMKLWTGKMDEYFMIDECEVRQ